MRRFFKKLFHRKPKPYLVMDKFEIVPVFTLNGENYYMHKNPYAIPAGRGLCAMVYLEEMLMRCDRQYLLDHYEATKKAIDNGKSIDITSVAILNENLKTRIDLLAAVPDQLFKLASVVFFTKDESPFRYDFDSAKAKIEEWQKAPDMYSFFLQTPLKDLVPQLHTHGDNSKQYLDTVKKTDALHRTFLQRLRSGKTNTTGARN